MGEVANRFPGKSCALCPNPSVGVGEHVWPSWLIKEFHDEGPFTVAKGGTAYPKRNGAPAVASALQSVHVPMCQECNVRLSRSIEEPAKTVIRKILPMSDAHSWPRISASEAESLARWFLKVALLLRHPEAVHDSPQVQRDPAYRRLDHLEREWLDWMKAEVAPPPSFSVFLNRRTIKGDPPWEGDELRLYLPDVTVGSKDLHYQTWGAGIRGLDATVVWHPHWPILHPLVEEGRAVRVWPDPTPVDLATLPEVHLSEFKFFPGGGSVLFRDVDEMHESVEKQPLQVRAVYGTEPGQPADQD